MSTEKMEPVAWIRPSGKAMLEAGGYCTVYASEGMSNHSESLFTSSQLQAAVAAERERCAKVCDTLAAGTLAGQFGSIDDLSNVMLRQVAVLGHQQCAAAIRQLGDEQ